MSNLVTHAEYELRRAGMFDSDADYGGALGNAVMELIRAFDKQRHSGFSATSTLALFGKLARFEPIGGITNNPDEWTEVAKGMWQNKRRGSSFSRDGGKTWYDIDNSALNNGDTWFSSQRTRDFLLDYGLTGDEDIVIDGPTKSRIFDEMYNIQKRHFGEKQEVGTVVIDRELNRRLRQEYEAQLQRR